MTGSRKRWILRVAVAAGLAAVGVAVAVVVAGNGSRRDADEQAEADVSTAVVEQRDLAEYLEISGTLDYEGTVTLTARNSGVLMQMVDEGTVVRQGDQIYLAVYEPSEADTARVLAEVAAARDALTVAAEKLDDAMSGPSEADVAAAQAAVAEAIEQRDRLAEPPTAAEISSAEAAVATASEVLDALDNPAAGDLAAARAELTAAQAGLDELQAGPSEAEIETAEAAVRIATETLADLKAGASEAEIETAEAARLAAWERLRDELQQSDNEVDIDLARAELLSAEEALADLLAGATEAEIDDAQARVSTATEQLAELRAGPSEAEIDDAQARVLAATERLDLLENPTEAQYAQARADLDLAREALGDLRAGPTQAETDAADAAVLTAEQALADLTAELGAEELAALEASLVSAQAALVSAQADLAVHSEISRPLHVMYGDVPAYRNMTTGLQGDDVRQLEESLAELGFGDADAFEADGIFDEHTAAAVRRWQQTTGQHVDGTVGTADVLFVAGPSQVGAWAAGVELGQELEVGRTLATLTVVETPGSGDLATTQRVAASLPLSDRDLVSEGITVNVELPDDTDIAGLVSEINPSPVLDAQTGENVVELTILLSEPASPVWIGATVTVEITETLISDALVVPATALVALVEGGNAVEVMSADGTSRLVGVETGLFVDGDVEVTSGELAAGMRVVVPR